jgi:hypothetical protein
VQTAAATLSPPHRLVDVPIDGLLEAVAQAPVAVSTMGRALDDDPAYFAGCAAAGHHAASLMS